MEVACEVLGISRSGYYAWKKRKHSQRELENQALIEHIRRIHRMSRKTYGSPRVHAALGRDGRWVNHKRVARLMRQEGLVGRRKHRKVVTTHSNTYPVAPTCSTRNSVPRNPTING